MYENKRILVLIPARGGSKGLPNKNLRKIANRSLVEWALLTAQKCSFVDDVIVSSDSEIVINKVNKYGQYAPFVRPDNLSKDNTPTLPVMQHTLEWIEENKKITPDYLVLLEPTSPFRLPEHVEEALRIAISTQATSVMSLVKVSDFHPVRVKKLSSNGMVEPFCIEEPEGLRRQDQEPAYIRNSAVCVFPCKTIINDRLWGNMPYGIKMNRELYGINIDDHIDLAAATFLYGHLKKESKLHLIDVLAKN